MSEITIKFGWPLRVGCREKGRPREEIGKTLEELSRSLTEKRVKIVAPHLSRGQVSGG